MAMYPPVRGNLMRQGVCVNSFQFIELAVFDDQPRQLERLGQFFQHRFAGRDTARRSLAARENVELREHFSDLLWRADIKFVTGKLVDVRRQLAELAA